MGSAIIRWLILTLAVWVSAHVIPGMVLHPAKG